MMIQVAATAFPLATQHLSQCSPAALNVVVFSMVNDVRRLLAGAWIRHLAFSICVYDPYWSRCANMRIRTCAPKGGELPVDLFARARSYFITLVRRFCTRDGRVQVLRVLDIPHVWNDLPNDVFSEKGLFA